MDHIRSISSRELSKLSGLTPRQLQNLDECGVVSPPIVSHRRQYSEIQARLIIIAGELDRRGICGQRMYRAIRMIDASLLQSGFLIVTASPVLVTHVKTQVEAIETFRQSAKSAWLVDLNRIALPLAA